MWLLEGDYEIAFIAMGADTAKLKLSILFLSF